MGDEMLEIAMARSRGYSGLALARYLDKQHQHYNLTFLDIEKEP